MSEAELFERYIQEMLHNCNVCTVEGWREYNLDHMFDYDYDYYYATSYKMDDIYEWFKQYFRRISNN